MDKEKINAILESCESLTAIERAFLAKKLIKWGASDMRIQANAIKNLTNKLDNSRQCADILRMELADFKAKEAFDTLKNAEQKLKASGGLGIAENGKQAESMYKIKIGNENIKVGSIKVKLSSGANIDVHREKKQATCYNCKLIEKTETEDDDWNGYQDGFNK